MVELKFKILYEILMKEFTSFLLFGKCIGEIKKIYCSIKKLKILHAQLKY